MVRADSEAECRRQLARLCAALGAVVTTPPSAVLGRGWVGRAVLTTEAPADGGGLPVGR